MMSISPNTLRVRRTSNWRTSSLLFMIVGIIFEFTVLQYEVDWPWQIHSFESMDYVYQSYSQILRYEKIIRTYARF